MSSEAGSPSRSQQSAGLEPVWLGIGSPRPQPRIKQNSMFGHVVDAFDEKSIVKIGEVTPYEKRMRAAEEAAAAVAAQKVINEELAERERKEMEQLREQLGNIPIKEDESGIDGINGTGVVADSVRPPPESVLDVNVRTHILVRGGRVVNDDLSMEADVYVVDGRISQLGPNLTVPDGVRIIDASGKLVLPGGMDSSTRFQAKFKDFSSIDDFCVGTKAALSGGTTTIVDCVVPEKGQSLVEAFDAVQSAAKSAVCCDFALRVAVVSWSDEVAKDMEILVNEKGVSSFLFSMSGASALDDRSLYSALKQCRQLGALAFIHAENGSMIELKATELISEGITGPEGHLLSHPEDVEASTVYRVITLASQTNTPICITKITGKMTADVIARSRRQGKVVYGESFCASLAVGGEHYYNKCWRHAAGFVTSPPLRTSADTKRCLVDRLTNGDMQFVGSDHCTFSAAQKAIGKDDFRWIPSGFNGASERMSVVWDSAVSSGKMDVCKFVAVTSTNAAKIFNLYPKKGRIAVGSDADLVVWDPNGEQTITANSQFSQCDFNVFEGMKFTGAPAYVISGGHVVFDTEGLHVAEGSGQFLTTPSSNEYVYSRIWAREKLEKPHPVERDVNDIPTLSTSLGNGDSADNNGIQRSPGEFYSRPPTRSGGRNMQDSTFSLSGVTNSPQYDEEMNKPGKRGCGTRINQPPGGKTSTSLW